MATTLLLTYSVVFVVAHATPGSPWDTSSPRPLDPQALANLNEKFGLNRSLVDQYFSYLFNAAHGDFGPSFRVRTETVADIIGQFLPVSLEIGAAAMLLAILAGLLLGGISALNQGSLLDRGIVLLATAAMSVPTYVFVALLVVILALQLRLVPTGGWDGILSATAVMPVVALAIAPASAIVRYFRSSMLETVGKDYVRTARAKGLSEPAIALRHMTRNALLPTVTVAGIYTADVLTGSFFVESMLGVPGLGRYFVLSISARDYPVIIGTTMVYAVIIVVMNFLADMCYAFLDPRVRND